MVKDKSDKLFTAFIALFQWLPIALLQISKWNNVWLNSDLSLTSGDFFGLLEAYQMWSIL